MNKCRICEEIKNNIGMVYRGKKLTKTCKDCSDKRRAKDYCIHNTRYHDCPHCQDPIIRRAMSMIHGSRISDKKKGRTCDLDFNWVLEQITINSKCKYCDIELGYIAPYLPNHCTIDRLDDNIGHLKSNCVVSCRSCNCYQNKYKYQLKL